MNGTTCTPNAADCVRRLHETYTAYQEALRDTVALREEAIPLLLAALNNKRAFAAAEALGHLMSLPQADEAIPRLLDFAFGQFPVFAEARTAVARAGVRALPHVLARLDEAVAEGDDEAVRNLLDVAGRLPEAVFPKVVQHLLQLLAHANPEFRAEAVAVLGTLGLPHAQPAVHLLNRIAVSDPHQLVRESAQEALTRLCPRDGSTFQD